MNNTVFLVFLIGYFLVVAGLGYGMHAAGISAEWITTMVLIAGGVGVIGALTRTRTTQSPPASTSIHSTIAPNAPPKRTY